MGKGVIDINHNLAHGTGFRPVDPETTILGGETQKE